jgi:hypothetical protein
VLNLGFTDTILRQSRNHHSGRRQIHRDPRKRDKFETVSNHCWFLRFFEPEGIVYEEFVPPGQTVNETSIVMFSHGWRKTSGANVQSSGATIPGPYTITTHLPTRHSLCGSFWLQRKRQ